jgi:hypothetical protein
LSGSFKSKKAAIDGIRDLLENKKKSAQRIEQIGFVSQPSETGADASASMIPPPITG